MRRTLITKSITSLTAILFFCSINSAFSESFDVVIDDRQKGFKKMGGAMKKMNRMLRAGESGQEDFIAAANTLASTAPGVVSWFPAGSGTESGVETEALAAIWEEPEKFSGAADKLVMEAEALLALVKKEETDPAVLKKHLRAVKDACSGCHKGFRLD